MKIDWNKYFEDITLIQGPGGNFSFKEDNSLVIKPSGANLKDVTFDKYTRLRIKDDNFLSSEVSYENYWRQVIVRGEKPSMEYGFHLLLKKYVFHFHDLSVIAMDKIGFNTMRNSLNSMDVRVDYIGYVVPGYDLSIEVRNLLESNQESIDIIFLQNHGIIITAKTEIELYRLMNIYTQARKENFEIIKCAEVPLDSLIEYIELFLNTGEFYFPDEAIFLHGQFALTTKKAKEVIKNMTFPQREILNYLFQVNNSFSRNDSRKLMRTEYSKLISLPSEKFRMNKLIS